MVVGTHANHRRVVDPLWRGVPQGPYGGRWPDGGDEVKGAWWLRGLLLVGGRGGGGSEERGERQNHSSFITIWALWGGLRSMFVLCQPRGQALLFASENITFAILGEPYRG